MKKTFLVLLVAILMYTLSYVIGDLIIKSGENLGWIIGTFGVVTGTFLMKITGHD